jgi:hypothetical protein
MAVAGGLLLAASPAYAVINADAPLGTTTTDGAGGVISFQIVDPDPVPIGYDGAITAELRHRFNFSTDPNSTQAFNDTFDFTTTRDGTGSLTFSTNAVNLLQSLTFSGVVGDVTFSTGSGSFDVAVLGNGHLGDLEGAPILANMGNVLSISGIAHGNAFYNGSVTFAPSSAVPEPATWSLLIVGFGAMGARLRSRNRATKWAPTLLTA